MTTKITVDNTTGAIAVDGTNGSLPAATETGQSLIASGTSWTAQATSLSWRNRVINGDMRVAQRGTSAFTAVSNTNVYPVDRWFLQNGTSTNITGQQSATAPTGFSNSCVMSTTTAVNSSGTQQILYQQRIEGFTISDLGYGTASAKTTTLSFWVRSSVTGTYGGSVAVSPDSTSYSYVFTYTINAQNTWEYKTVTVTGFTNKAMSGVNNGVGIYLSFDLGSPSGYETTPNTWVQGDYKRTSGCVKWANNANATFYITGVQLEIGTTSTPFEMLQYGKQLALCQRYYQRFSSLTGTRVGFACGCATSSTVSYMYVRYNQVLRAKPTTTIGSTAVIGRNVMTVQSGVPYYGNGSLGVTLSTNVSTQAAGDGALWIGNDNASAYIALDAEL